MDVEKVLLLVGLAIIVLLVGRALLRSDKSPRSLINLEDLLLGDDGRLSKAAAVMFGAYGLTTWVIVNLTITGKLTEGYFTAYVTAWVAPAVAKLIFSKDTTPQ